MCAMLSVDCRAFDFGSWLQLLLPTRILIAEVYEVTYNFEVILMCNIIETQGSARLFFLVFFFALEKKKKLFPFSSLTKDKK